MRLETAITSQKEFGLWKKERRIAYPLHKMMSRPGSMPPWLASYFILKYSTSGDLVLDPFCGKGTVLLEAALNGRRALGFDVAPDAIIVSNAKLNPPSLSEVSKFLSHIEFREARSKEMPWQITTFFSPKTLTQILYIRDRLQVELTGGTLENKRTANFIMGTLLGILHGHSKLSLSLPCSHSFGMAPNYVREYARREGLRRPYRDVAKCLMSRAEQLLSQPPSSTLGNALLSTAENYPLVDGTELSNAVDLIVTSPPYLNMQTYAKDSWLRLWLLGYDHKVLKRQFIETGSPQIYLSKMEPCLKEMLMVLKPNKYAVIIAGDAPFTDGDVKRVFKTAQELGVLATRLDNSGYTFKVETMILDEIPAYARYYSAVHKDGKEGNYGKGRKGVKRERIIVLQKVKASRRGTGAK